MTTAERQAKRYARLRKSINRKRRAAYKAKKESATKQAARQATQQRRQASRNAQPLPDGFDYRVGDFREVLADIPDNSVPLILTDPPYEIAALPLWLGLADFAKRKLIPGGSLICYFGGASVNKLYRIFDDAGLEHHFAGWLQHDKSQRLAGKFVIPQGKSILWYVKGFRRGRTLVPNMVSDSIRDKSEHNWAQGDGGIRVWIHHLSEPGETIVDPFCGPETWGRIATSMGRRWIGSDIERGGTTTIAA
jgi:hypothetical protein